MSSHRLFEDIADAEGLRLTAYKDTLGFWTIGYGHFLEQNKNWEGYTISQEEATDFLLEDIYKAEKEVKTDDEWPSLDTECRQNAVIELFFNMGHKWEGFTKTRECLKNKDWQGAHDNLLDSLWAKQVGETRSKRLAGYLLTGEYPWV